MRSKGANISLYVFLSTLYMSLWLFHLSTTFLCQLSYYHIRFLLQSIDKEGQSAEEHPNVLEGDSKQIEGLGSNYLFSRNKEGA